jgi:Concanavalin A-like lectin/glucanases superfamily
MDGARATIATYVNGVAMGETMVPWQLSQLDDVNNWLGRSQWMQDRFLQGRIDEFRIYGAALSGTEIASFNTRGPNAP